MPLPIEDATIIISEPNGTSDCHLTYIADGEYISEGCYPENEKQYIISVYSPTYGKVSSSSSIPKKAKITVEKSVINDEETTIDFTVEEQSDLEDYYIWDLVDVLYSEETDPAEPFIKPGKKININNWVETIEDEINDIKNNNLTSNISTIGGGDAGSTFKESIKTKTDRITRESLTSTGPKGELKTKTMLRVMTVSKELYEYFKSIESYLSYKDYNPSFHEPITVFDNIEGGIGIFAGYSVEYADIPQ